MSNFTDISNDFRRVDGFMKARLRSALYEECRTLMSEFQERSPVDSGYYRQNWRVKVSRFKPAGTYASYSISNATSYAPYMEYGAEIGQAPWYFGTKAKRSGSGKLMIRNGMVWAGGRNPGHSLTVGGAIGPALVDNNRRLNQLTSTIADVIVGGFK